MYCCIFLFKGDIKILNKEINTEKQLKTRKNKPNSQIKYDIFSFFVLRYNYHDAIGIFSERVKRISDKTFKNGHVFWHELIRNPLKIFYIFPYLRYIMLLFWCRVTKK